MLELVRGGSTLRVGCPPDGERVLGAFLRCPCGRASPPQDPATDLAADGIDELIDVFLDADPDADFPERRHRDAGRRQQSGSWVLEIGEGVRRTRRQPTAWVRGSVDQILLDLWGRPSEANHQGDRKPMNHFRKIAVFG